MHILGECLNTKYLDKVHFFLFFQNIEWAKLIERQNQQVEHWSQTGGFRNNLLSSFVILLFTKTGLREGQGLKIEGDREGEPERPRGAIGCIPVWRRQKSSVPHAASES